MGLFDESQQRQFIAEDRALRQAPAGAESEWPQDVLLRLDPHVVDGLLAGSDSGATITGVVLDAFDRCRLQLGQIAPPALQSASPLAHGIRVAPGEGPAPTVHLLLTAVERQQLEEVADRTVPGSLTDLVERVLRYHLELAVVAAGCCVWATFAFEYVARLAPTYPWFVPRGVVGPPPRRAAVATGSADRAFAARKV